MTWQDSAACRELPLAWFFPEPGQRPEPRAIAACQTCPVRAQCGRHADRYAEVGVWAGLSENARNERRRARRLPKPPPVQRAALRDLELELAPLPKDPRHRAYRARRRTEQLERPPA